MNTAIESFVPSNYLPRQILQAKGIAILCVMVISLLSWGVTASNTLKILGDDPMIMIDPDLKKGKTVVHFQNVSGEALPVLITAGKIYNEASGKVVTGLIQFKKPGGAVYSPIYQGTIDKDGDLALEVEISLYVESSETYFYLLDGQDTLTRVDVLHGNIPFSLQLSAENPNDPVITLERKQQTSMVITNDDAMNHYFDWSLYIPEAGLFMQDSMVRCPAKGNAVIFLDPPDPSFKGCLNGYFKDWEGQGQLMLTYRSAGDFEFNWPSKTIKVKARMKYHSEGKKGFWGTIIILVLLAMGGAASAILNIWMPNKLKRLELLKQLKKIAAKTREVSNDIHSGLRVGIRVSRLQMIEETKAVRAIYPDSAQALEELQKRMKVLDKRVELIRKLDNVSQLFGDSKGEAFSAPASRMDQVTEWLEAATEKLMLVMPDESYLNEAEENIKRSKEMLGNMTAEDPKFALKLAESLKSQAEAFKELKNKEIFKKLHGGIKNLVEVVLDPDLVKKYSDPAFIQPRHYHWLSSSMERLYVLRHYITIWEAHEERRKEMEKREHEFVQSLNSRTYHSLETIRKFRDEFTENIFPDQVRSALMNGSFTVDVVPTIQPKPNETVSLEIRFHNGELNDCSALKEVRCEWIFTNIGTERGWNILHYFRTEDEAKFNVRFIARKGDIIQVNGKDEFPVNVVSLLITKEKRDSGRWWIELVRFLIAFALAIIALYVGAKEQIMKLDLVSGLIAVFMLGYGADTIKNLVTKKPPSGASDQVNP